MKLRAYVLHLLRAQKRRDNAHSLLETCGVAGHIWPAVDGAALPGSDVAAAYRKDLIAPRYPFDLRIGEIGCFLSHRQIWADLQDSDADAALIIEDDAGLDRDLFTQALSLATEHIGDLGYIQFQTRPARSAATLIDQIGPCTLLLPQSAGLRTTAQLVSKAAAATLLRHSAPFDRPVDTFVQSYWHTGLRPAMILPSGISEIADQLDGSTIQTAQKSVREKLRREIARGMYRNAVKRLSRKAHQDV